MGLIAALHRWWGVAFCLLFAMWFVTGIVMHFVPFPARSEAFAEGSRADSEQAARNVATEYVRTRGWDAAHATVRRVDYDQWTVSGDYDSDRPLWRVALHDAARHQLYVSSAKGHVVLVTTWRGRALNTFGSIPHWIYAAPLRHRTHLWRAVVWWLSLLGTIGAGLGAIAGIAKLALAIRNGTPAYRGLQALHHYLGLAFAPVIIAWIFTGFLSLEDEWPLRSLHTLDFPPLSTRPWLRTIVVTALCLAGLGFSLTAVVLALRRVRPIKPTALRDAR